MTDFPSDSPRRATMRGVVIDAYETPLRVVCLPRPAPGPGEVLLRTLSCGICRTDLHMAEGSAYRPALPHVPGHEPAGEVVALGAGVTGWAPGDRAVPYLFEWPEGAAGGPSILGVTRHGAFAEYFTARAENLVAIPLGLDPALAGLAACAGVTAVHAVDRGALRSGDEILVIGTGGIGTLVLQILHAGGFPAVAVDRRAENRELARAAGAEFALAPEDLPAEPTFDRVFDLVGTRATTGLAGAVIRQHGRIIIVGEEPDEIAINTTAIAQREIEIVGSRNGSRADMEQAIQLMADGVLRPVIDSRQPLDGLNAAINRMRSGGVTGRIVVTFDG